MNELNILMISLHVIGKYFSTTILDSLFKIHIFSYMQFYFFSGKEISFV